MICKVCGKEAPETIRGICSEECVNELKKQELSKRTTHSHGEIC